MESCMQENKKNVLSPNYGKCNCDRKKKYILCKTCGNAWCGRIKAQCTIHKNVIFLMDIDQCPNPKCESLDLEEYD